VSSTLACVGLGVSGPGDFEDLLARALPLAVPVGEGPGYEYHRWTDESGARLTIRARDGDPDYAVPSFAGVPGVRLSGVTAVTGYLASADVLGIDDEVSTRLLCELEQSPFLEIDPVSGDAAVTAFGVDVRVHVDDAAYEASDDSLLEPTKKDEPRPESLPELMRWPLRKAAESFVSYGLFGEPAGAEPYAMLSGTVLSAETHTVALTGQTFHVARAASVGMEVDVCLAAADHPEAPPVGGIVTGTVYLVASVESLWPPP
jgi:hypothetical protein